ncbi:MAG: hypothetical protein GXO20_03740 [Thermodesulfobacteria bacterium]|nr:hypothetical protein [Thermodesulfobacteriota bacterium]
MRVRTNIIALFFLCVFLVCGCTTTTQNSTSQTTTTVASKPYYSGTEFPDIVIPKDMKIDQSRSMIVKTKDYVGGVLVLKGRVKAKSLEEFFKNQLRSRGWDLIGSVYYRNTLLAFRRENGSCMVYIANTSFSNTEVQIWVSEDLEANESFR